MDKPPAGPSLQDLDLGSPVPYPHARSYKVGPVREGFLVNGVARVGKQPAATFILNCSVNVKGVPR